jgi:hypothetical protein
LSGLGAGISCWAWEAGRRTPNFAPDGPMRPGRTRLRTAVGCYLLARRRSGRRRANSNRLELLEVQVAVLERSNPRSTRHLTQLLDQLLQSAMLERRTFGETRRRTKVIGRLPGETSCLGLVWAVLDRASRGWRGLTMSPKALRLLQDLRRQLLHPRAEEVIDEAVSSSGCLWGHGHENRLNFLCVEWQGGHEERSCWRIAGGDGEPPPRGYRLCWWAWQVLNLRPLPCEPSALVHSPTRHPLLHRVGPAHAWHCEGGYEAARGRQ